MSSEIQVSGITCFPQERWREAILFYLFGLWANKEIVAYRPKIAFGTIVLRLDESRGEYYAYGRNQDGECPPFLLPIKEELVVGPAQEQVEIGLVRFVKNDRIRRLAIKSANSGLIWLWKQTKRGQYRVCASSEVPHSNGDCIAEDFRNGKT